MSHCRTVFSGFIIVNVTLEVGATLHWLPFLSLLFETLMTRFRWAFYPSAISLWRSFSSVLVHQFLRSSVDTASFHCPPTAVSYLLAAALTSGFVGYLQRSYNRMIAWGWLHAKITTAAISTASSADSRIHSMKYYGCQMTAWVIFNLLYITWAKHSSIHLPLLLSVSSTATFNSVLKPLKFLSSFNLPTVSFY